MKRRAFLKISGAAMAAPVKSFRARADLDAVNGTHFSYFPVRDELFYAPG